MFTKVQNELQLVLECTKDRDSDLNNLVSLLEQSLGRLTGLNSKNCSKENFERLLRHLLHTLKRDQDQLRSNRDEAEICDHLDAELRTFVSLGLEHNSDD